MKESVLQKVAKTLITHKFEGYLQRAQSGKVKVTSRNKEGHSKEYAVTMAESGTPDMVGFVPVVITPDMVGKTVAVFVGVETKKDWDTVQEWKKKESVLDPRDMSDRSTVANQIRHKKRIVESGGVYILASHPDDIVDIIQSKDFPFCHE